MSGRTKQLIRIIPYSFILIQLFSGFYPLSQCAHSLFYCAINQHSAWQTVSCRTGRVSIARFSPSRVRLVCACLQPALLVMCAAQQTGQPTAELPVHRHPPSDNRYHPYAAPMPLAPGRYSPRKSRKLRTAGVNPRRELNTACTMPGGKRHWGSTCTNSPRSISGWHM